MKRHRLVVGCLAVFLAFSYGPIDVNGGDIYSVIAQRARLRCEWEKLRATRLASKESSGKVKPTTSTPHVQPTTTPVTNEDAKKKICTAYADFQKKYAQFVAAPDSKADLVGLNAALGTLVQNLTGGTQPPWATKSLQCLSKIYTDISKQIANTKPLPGGTNWKNPLKSRIEKCVESLRLQCVVVPDPTNTQENVCQAVQNLKQVMVSNGSHQRSYGMLQADCKLYEVLLRHRYLEGVREAYDWAVENASYIEIESQKEPQSSTPQPTDSQPTDSQPTDTPPSISLPKWWEARVQGSDTFRQKLRCRAMGTLAPGTASTGDTEDKARQEVCKAVEDYILQVQALLTDNAVKLQTSGVLRALNELIAALQKHEGQSTPSVALRRALALKSQIEHVQKLPGAALDGPRIWKSLGQSVDRIITKIQGCD